MRVEGACNLLAGRAMSPSNPKLPFFMSLGSSQHLLLIRATCVSDDEMAYHWRCFLFPFFLCHPLAINKGHLNFQSCPLIY